MAGRRNRARDRTGGRAWRFAALIAVGIVLPASGEERIEADTTTEEETSVTWKDDLSNRLKEVTADIDEFADATWRSFSRRMGFHEPRHIAAYRGYANREKVWVSGRLLANRPYGGPAEDDNWWANLKATYNRWESDEVPGAAIRLEYSGSVKTVETDDEGYYHAVFEVDRRAPRTDVITAQHGLEDRTLTAVHRISIPDPRASYMVVSDMDDTVIHTGITNLLLSAQLTFLNNARTRKPLTGVGSLYRELARGTADRPVNPIFYLSNSAWNMYDLLRDFLDLNDLPYGPLLLRDIGSGSDTSDHKIETLRKLVERFAPLPVLLVGDSGQHDAEIYAQVAIENADRVKAIYIRDVDPDKDSDYDRKVDDIIERSMDLGISFKRVADSTEIASDLLDLGILTTEQLARVSHGVDVDRGRETLAEEVAVGADSR